MARDIGVQALTTCGIAANGRYVRMNFTDTHGCPSSLTLPTDCAQQLIMTLPELVSRALQAELSDDSVRAVFTLGGWRVESATSKGHILTMSTPDGFAVSFAVSTSDLREMTSRLSELWSAEH
jgi:hypothetical protein